MNIKKLKHTQLSINTDRIILLSGNGQNVGKTTFACQLINHMKNIEQKVYALKVSPKIHEEQPPYTIFSNENFVLSLEKKKNTGKDSSRYLKAGADESFFLQVYDKDLEEAIRYTFSLIPKDVIVIAESGGMRNFINPALFFFLKKKGDQKIKEKAQKWPELADGVIHFDGSGFDFDVDKIIIESDHLKLID
jgi:hypothetical protein